MSFSDATAGGAIRGSLASCGIVGGLIAAARLAERKADQEADASHRPTPQETIIILPTD
jgi:hypothetical protein